MLNGVVVVATVVGGVAGLWFLLDKARTVRWVRPFSKTDKKNGTMAVTAGVDTDSKLSSQLNWPKGAQPNYPTEVVSAVVHFFPEHTLPSSADIVDEWVIHANTDTLEPFFCSGDFTGGGGREFAVFLLRRNKRDYRVVAFIRIPGGGLSPREISSGSGNAQNMFITTIKPGNYRPGPSVHKLGSPSVVRLRRDAIGLGTFESASSIVYWNRRTKRFIQVWMSD